MKTQIQEFTDIVARVTVFYKQMQLQKLEKRTGRKLAISIIKTVSLGVFKGMFDVTTKKSIFKIFKPNCSYKTLVVNLNKFALHALAILKLITRLNQINAHPIKHTDSTDIPVCQKRNGKNHKTMRILANWGTVGKGLFYGLKLHITTDLKRRLLSFKITSGNVDDRKPFMNLNKDMNGIFIADRGYISKKLAKDFHIEGKRFLIAKPKANMKKLASELDNLLYDTRMIIELNFRSLKQFHGLITSLPRSIDGYFANYIYSLLAYVCA